MPGTSRVHSSEYLFDPIFQGGRFQIVYFRSIDEQFGERTAKERSGKLPRLRFPRVLLSRAFPETLVQQFGKRARARNVS